MNKTVYRNGSYVLLFRNRKLQIFGKITTIFHVDNYCCINTAVQ